MRKFILIFISIISINSFAQKKEAEQLAQKKTDYLDSKLNLTEEQKDKVYKLNLEVAIQIKSAVKKINNPNTSEEEKEKIRGQRKAFSDQYKKGLKGILTQEQYQTWIEIRKQRKNELKAKGRDSETVAKLKTEKMNEQLSLNSEQYEKIYLINYTLAQEINEFLNTKGPETFTKEEKRIIIKDRSSDYENDLKAILTAEQFEKWSAKKESKKKKIKEKNKKK